MRNAEGVYGVFFFPLFLLAGRLSKEKAIGGFCLLLVALGCHSFQLFLSTLRFEEKKKKRKIAIHLHLHHLFYGSSLCLSCPHVESPSIIIIIIVFSSPLSRFPLMVSQFNL